jgi:hypothetical protein
LEINGWLRGGGALGHIFQEIGDSVTCSED